MARRKPDISDDDLPVAFRALMSYGPTAVMRATWRDPEDTRPNAARNPREVKGHRAFDPLRWSRRRHGDASSFSDLHIFAADRLRLVADMARLGGLPGTVWAGAATPTQPSRYGPSTGFSEGAKAMAKAHTEYHRVMSILSPHEYAVVVGVVLDNVSISEWTRHRISMRFHTSPQIETRCLVAALDKLVEYYDTEIREDMALGRVEA